ncbi:MAG: FAD-binding protein [Roseburia sp.]|nr:FAD-binding protein [Roseburia sp.]MCM1430957.1 FAD-binding protein [Muribaculaceae bacterium]
MVRINQIRVPAGSGRERLEEQIQKILRLKPDAAFTFRIVKKSLDARKKPVLYDVYAVLVKLPGEEKLVQRLHNPSVTIAKEARYVSPAVGETPLHNPPVVAGAGPAGLFAACQLAESGFAPVVVERGRRVSERKQDVEAFWRTGVLRPDSNVQFGEGGAGTFSDGKLNTTVSDPLGRNACVLEHFVRFGAPECILYESKPHIGTDVLETVIQNMRDYLEAKGTTFYFGTKLQELLVENGSCRGVSCETAGGTLTLETEAVVLAPGHSARDTFQMLERMGIPMEAKSFAVGFRVEHPQKMIDYAMYGDYRESPLPAAPYKVTSNFPGGRGVYSFCMCPGGYVVNASSEKDGTAVNGMSYSGRNGANANSAIIVSVSPKDFGAGALAGMEYQRRLEHESYRLGQGRIPQQLYGDYIQNVKSSGYGDFSSAARGAVCFANLRGLMTEEMERAFMDGMSHFARIIADFDRKDAILSGMETRTSSPVRILRDERCESGIHGIYPCGEGAGYAGGIMSAAIDGLRVAASIIEQYHPAY